MKKLFTLLMLVFTITLANAQTSVRIDPVYQNDSIYTHQMYCCNKHLEMMFYMSGVAHGYNMATDSITISFDYGDGSTFAFKTNIFNDSLFYISSSYHDHYYANMGFVDFIIYAIAPDGKKDSVMKENFFVGDTCGNITGNYYLDANTNCQKDIGESTFYFFPPMKLYHNNQDLLGSYVYGGFYYSFYGVPVNLDYDVVIFNNPNGDLCPFTQHVASVPASNVDFGLQCTVSQSELVGYMFGTQFRPGATNANITIGVYNYGCIATAGKVKLIYDNTLLTPTTSNIPYTISGDTIIWNMSSLSSYITTQASFTPNIYFNVSTSAQIGDTVCFTLIEAPVINAANPASNMQKGCWPIRNSYDPNDKAVSPAGEGPHGFIENNLSMMYRLRFQNTGNDYAENIYIIDTLDNNLEFGTFQVLNSSHFMLYELLDSNVVKFVFPNIYLPDSGTNQQGSNGYVCFSVRQKPDLAVGKKIKNTGYIYFDYNPAIVTNTTLNTIVKFPDAIQEIETGSSISIFPNPSTGLIHLSFTEPAKDTRVEVMNSCGQLVSIKTINNQSQTTLDLSTQAKGMYFIKVQSGSGVVVRKVVISE